MIVRLHRFLSMIRKFPKHCFCPTRPLGICVKSCSAVPELPDPFNYTSGRWLHRDKEQLEARRLRFDFAGLCAKVVSLCDGAERVLSYEKKEGGFNRVFIFHLDNGQQMVARLPFKVTIARDLVVQSEVATMRYGSII